MPTELLERPVEIEEAPLELSEAITIRALEKGKEEASPRSLLRKVFEGHEEFLGCTPD